MNNEDVYYEEFSRKPKNKFEIGDVVRLLDGDGRPHLIDGLYWTWSIHHENGGWWEYSFADSGPKGTMNERNLELYIDKNGIERTCRLLEDMMHVIPVDDDFAVICNEDQSPFNKETFIQQFKEKLLKGY